VSLSHRRGPSIDSPSICSQWLCLGCAARPPPSGACGDLMTAYHGDPPVLYCVKADPPPPLYCIAAAAYLFPLLFVVCFFVFSRKDASGQIHSSLPTSYPDTVSSLIILSQSFVLPCVESAPWFHCFITPKRLECTGHRSLPPEGLVVRVHPQTSSVLFHSDFFCMGSMAQAHRSGLMAADGLPQ